MRGTEISLNMMASQAKQALPGAELSRTNPADSNRCSTYVLPLEEIAPALVRLVTQRSRSDK